MYIPSEVVSTTDGFTGDTISFVVNLIEVFEATILGDAPPTKPISVFIRG